MNEDFVTYEQADKLCDLGFDLKCIACYDEEEFEITSEYSNYNSDQYRYNLISAPTLSQAQKWLREMGTEVLVYKDLFKPKYYNLQYIVDGTVSADDVQCDTYAQQKHKNLHERQQQLPGPGKDLRFHPFDRVESNCP